MAKKLKNVSVNSVDLCKQGANQRAFICLKKSIEEENTVSDLKTSIIQNVCKELNITVEDICKALGVSMQEQQTQEQKIKKAMETSLISVLKDESKTAEQKEELLQKSVNEFYSTVYDFAKEEQKQEETMDINKMNECDSEIYEKLKKKYEPEIQTVKIQQTLHPEVKKALKEAETAKQELEELKKSLELKEFENIAKQYEVIGKNTEELSAKLYDLKKSNEQAYNDYIAMLDEMVEMTQASGIFKEYGSSRAGAGSKKQQAEQRIQELMKSDTALSYADAFVRVCEENEELKKALEY
ncbi:hypothetical protein [Clostridium sp. MD294]|uniref:hypothetical protein n=1 Tax=Clostridium sp. MD294 TaxID=97138 RepID=UPI0002C9ACE3|nr:hypothetical protein [Clostridium sp. MD294]NDO45977.1 hypothetical protein [Clostridium sp. MD294]USF30365.1 hypothetical protein C820_001806 [Clostridium sp. MD294]